MFINLGDCLINLNRVDYFLIVKRGNVYFLTANIKEIEYLIRGFNTYEEAETELKKLGVRLNSYE